MKKIDPHALNLAKEHAEKTYPQEACGLFFERKTSGAITLFEPCRNIQNDLHRVDPKRYPRDARTAYNLDPKEILSLEKKWQGDYKICGIFHSHNDSGVYFSDEDIAMACPWEDPLFPDRFYLIWGIDQGKSVGASLFYWNADTREFEAGQIPQEEVP